MFSSDLIELLPLLLSPIRANCALVVFHFPTLSDAMDAAQHLVEQVPTAVELVDRTMIGLSRDIAMFRPVVDRFVRGDPGAILLVEFAEEDHQENLRRLAALGDLMAQLGFRWGDAGKRDGGVVEAVEPNFQKQIWEVRQPGPNILLSMKSERKTKKEK